MAADKNKFIGDLVAQHTRRAVLPLPGVRAFRWFVAAVAVNAAVLWLFKPYRPGFAGQMLEHPRLLLEVVAALLGVAAGAYLFCVRAIPGERLSRAARASMAAVVAVLLIVLARGVVTETPDFGASGARPGCWIEGVLYGGATLLSLLAVVRRGYPRLSRRGLAVLGGVAGLLPASLMHMACMYNPDHALVYHYGPVAALAIVAGLLIRRPAGCADR